MTTTSSDKGRQKVLVTGANGYIGHAVARAFVRAGWHTYGLTRQESSLANLRAEEITPILGSPTDLAFIKEYTKELSNLDVIVSTTEQTDDYVPHYEAVVKTLRELSGLSNQKVLVLFTSGCKDYGMTDLASSPNLRAHTEDDALNPPAFAEGRAHNASRIFDNRDMFDAVLLRPTSVYGYDSSYYGASFELAEAIADKQRSGSEEGWNLPSDPDVVMHALHVDDCGDAYVALAESPREKIKGEVFNISGRRYETLNEVVEALRSEYNIKSPPNYTGLLGQSEKAFGLQFLQAVIGFSQFVSSEKIRRVTGWEDKRAMFSDDIGVYRRAYEAWRETNSGDGSRASMLREAVRAAF